MNLRGKIFFINDRLHGGKVQYALKCLRYTDSLDSDSKELISHVEKCKRDIIAHAVKTVEFYNGYQGKEFSDMPVVTKDIIRDNYNAFLSSAYNPEKAYSISTSGSSGTPFTSLQNPTKRKTVQAELIYYNSKLGYEVGDRTVFIRSLKGKGPSWLRQFIQNSKRIPLTGLDDLSLENMLDELYDVSKSTPVQLSSYGGTLYALARYYKRHDSAIFKRCNVSGVISGSEMIHDSARTAIEEAFGVRCLSRYANQENGVIGQDDEENNVFILNEYSYFTEVLKLDSDEPAELGEVGRVVITDFFNKQMPFIRYDTGDIGALNYVTVKGVKKKALTDFSGRKIDMIYDTTGRPISPHKISVAFWGVEGVRRYRFEQTDEKYYRAVLLCGRDYRLTMEPALVASLKEIVGSDAVIDVDYLRRMEIPESGKQKYIVNLWKNPTEDEEDTL